MLTQLNEEIFNDFESNLKKKIHSSRIKFKDDSDMNEYLNTLEEFLNDREKYCIEAAKGYYYLHYNFSDFSRMFTTCHWLSEKLRESMSLQMEILESLPDEHVITKEEAKFFEKCREKTNLYSSYSTYGLADNVEQIQKYVTDMVQATGLDEEVDYIVSLHEYSQGKSDFRWHKQGHYIGTHDSLGENFSDSPEIETIISFDLITIKK